MPALLVANVLDALPASSASTLAWMTCVFITCSFLFVSIEQRKASRAPAHGSARGSTLIGTIDASSIFTMASTNGKRVASEGFGLGVVAGVIFLAVEMFDAAVTRTSPLVPLRSAASIVIGAHALDSSFAMTYVAGLAVHLVLSGLFGLGYAEIEARLPADARRHYLIQIGIGVAYAALLWLVSVELIAYRFFPWFVTARPMKQLVLQALFFGAPLGLMFAAAVRRMPQVIRPSVG